MADVERDIILRVKSETDQATGQFKNLKQELRSIENELNKMSEAGQTGTKAFQELQRRAGEVKDQIGDTKSAIKALSSDTFKLDAFTQAAQGIAGGFAAAQGAMALFGSENKEIEEAIKKTQGAMALLQGVTAITNVLQKESAFSLMFLNKAQTENAVATNVATTATKGFSRALVATGIGAIIVLIGTLVAYWDDLKEAVGGVSKETENYIDVSKKDTEQAQKKYDLTKDTENILKLQGKSQRDILNIKIKETDAIISGIKNQIEGQRLATKQAVDAAKRNQEIATGVIMAIFSPIKAVTLMVDGLVNGLVETANFFGADIDFKLNLSSFDELIAETIFDPEEVAAQGKKTEEELQKSLDKILNEQAGFKLEVKKIDDEADKKKIEDAKKLKSEEEKILKERQKNTEEFNDLTFKGLEKTSELQEQANEGRKQSLLGLIDYVYELNNVTQAEIRSAEARKQIEDDLLKKRVSTFNEWADITKDGLSALSDLNDAFSKKDEEGQRKAFERDKKFRIASAIIQTAQGVAGQLAVPQDQLSATNFAKAAIVLATGIAQIKKISDTKFQGGTPPSSSGSTPSVNMSPNQQNTNTPNINSTMLNVDAQGNLVQNRSIRTYVVESDISQKQKRSRQLSNTAIIGK